MARLTAAECGDRCFAALSAHPGGLNRIMLRLHSELTEARVARGLAYLDDLSEDEEYDFYVRVREGGEWIYRLGGENPRDARQHYLRIIRTRITQAERAYKRTKKMHLSTATAETERQVDLAERLLKDLRYILRTFTEDEAA